MVAQTRRYEAVAVGKRIEEWQRSFGRTVFPIVSPEPFLAVLPGLGHTLVYLLDFDALCQSDQEPVILATADRFKISVEQAWRTVELDGMPIRADHVTIRQVE